MARNCTVLGSPRRGIANRAFARHAGIRLNLMKRFEAFRASSRNIPDRKREHHIPSMNEEQRSLLSLMGRPPARLRADQVAHLLNCSAHDIPILIGARLLKPLGSPAQNGTKYFATSEIAAHAEDRVWLARATEVIRRHWLTANGNRASHPSPARRSIASTRLRPIRNSPSVSIHEEHL